MSIKPKRTEPGYEPHPAELGVMVVCDPCGSIISAQWIVREEAPKQAVLCVQKCRCSIPEVSDAAIDEAIVRLMDQAGTLSSGWNFRDQLSYARDHEAILRSLLAGELEPTPDPPEVKQ